MKMNNVIPFPATRAAAPDASPQRLNPPSAEPIDFASYQSRGGSDWRFTGASRSLNKDCALTPHEVWEAVSEGRVVMHYQPQYDILTGKTVAAEALIRLVDHDNQLIYPDRFIASTEQSDIIVPMGRAVIEQVCIDLAALRAAGFTLQRIAINLSAHQINSDTTLLAFIDKTLADHGLRYEDLEFEITERQNLSPDGAGMALLQMLAKLGARVVIDDFGIGYSSVVYLTELPISAFKLDRALVTRLPEDRAMRSVVKSLLRLARELEIDVVAEGIESEEQNTYLADQGCPYAQGFGYARPMALADLETFLTGNVDMKRLGYNQE